VIRNLYSLQYVSYKEVGAILVSVVFSHFGPNDVFLGAEGDCEPLTVADHCYCCFSPCLIPVVVIGMYC